MIRTLLLSLCLLSSVAGATSFKGPLSFDQLALQSRAVIRGTIVASAVQSTSHGLQTRYTIEVNETLSGHSDPIVHLTLPGGSSDGLTQRFIGVPLWSPGDEVLIFAPATNKPVSLRGLFTVQGQHLIDPIAHRSVISPKTIEQLQVIIGDLSL